MRLLPEPVSRWLEADDRSLIPGAVLLSWARLGRWESLAERVRWGVKAVMVPPSRRKDRP
jgi:hypothetical protein